MIWKHFRTLFFILSFFYSISGAALPPSQRGMAPPPIQIHSDTASFDSRAGVAIHRGSVLLSQGDRKLFADELLVKRDNRGKIQLVTAIGRPARYTGIDPKDRTLLVGQATRILYQPEKMLLVLEGNAELRHSPNVFRGPRIQYDFARRVITAPPIPNERSVLILQPR